MRIIIVADPHIGLDRFGTTPEEWDAPLNEAVDYAIETKVDVFVIAGDAQNNRNPTMAQHMRLWEPIDRLEHAGVVVAGLVGNHDIGAVLGSLSTVNFQSGHWFYGQPGWMAATGALQIVMLPWPRPVDYQASPFDPRLSPEAAAREGVLNKLNTICGNLNPDLPAILIGHAMLSYGKESPTDPGLAFGKDVLLPAGFFSELPNIGACFFGHCHVPDDLYIGSTQPTDWGMAGKELSFIELLIEPESAVPPAWAHANYLRGWNYRWRRFSYRTSLRLVDFSATFHGDYPPEEWESRLAQALDIYAETHQGPFDVARASIRFSSADQHIDPAVVRRLLTQHATRVESVNVIPFRGEKRRSELAGDGLAAVDRTRIPEAVQAWAQERSLTAKQTDALATGVRALQEEKS